MAQSPEYPDLPFVQPRAFGRGRDGKAVRYLVVHYTAGSERSTSAEDGAAYDQRRTGGTSCHYFVDQNSIVQCVRTTDRGNSAFSKGNRLGIQYELCGTVQTRAQWLDTASDATLTNAARQMARDCIRYGIPVRRLSVAETRAAWYQFPNGPKGIVGHVDVTRAYPEDGGDHTDPGSEFPWDVLLARVQHFVGTGGVPAFPHPLEDDVTPEELYTIVNSVQEGIGYAGQQDLTAPSWARRGAAYNNQAVEARLTAKLDALSAADQARDTATKAAVDALVAVINTAGGSVDAAPILARIDAVAADVGGVRAQLAAAQSEVEELRRQLAEAHRASADALGG